MKNAIIFGAGNIGRGFIGQLFHESGYSITLVDVDDVLLQSINQSGSYTIELVDNEKSQRVQIPVASALHSSRDRQAVIEVFSKASLGATAVGQRVLPFIAPLIAAGVQRRLELGITQPVNLIVCENLKNAAAILHEMIEQHLPPSQAPALRPFLGLVDTVIGRMVPPPTPEMRALDPGWIRVETYKELPVDRQGFAGQPPLVSGMQVIDNFPAYTARKLYIHNCGHAVLAYLGYLAGYEFGWQALQDLAILSTVQQALSESIQGIVQHYGVSASWLESHVEDLLKRFANRALGDTVFRLGRDPLRKLAPTDRLVGAARLAESAGIVPAGIARGIAAAFHFNPPEDPLAQELQMQIKQKGLDQVLSDVCAIQLDESLSVLIKQYYHTT